MKKSIIFIVIILISVLSFAQDTATLIVKPSSIRLGIIVDIDTIASSELGDIALNNDSIVYQYTGAEWIPFGYRTTAICQCCSNIRSYSFTGNPSQRIFETVFGHQNFNYEGVLYNTASEKTYPFAYLYFLSDHNWKYGKYLHE